MADQAEQPFSIAGGGPFLALARRLRFRRPDGRVHIAWLVAIAWVPLVVASAVRLIAGGAVDPLLGDVSVHTRLLVAVPVLLGTEPVLEQTCRAAFHQLHHHEMVGRETLNGIAERAHRWRDTIAVEALLAAAAVTFGQLVLWRVVGSTGLVHGGDRSIWSFARFWYCIVALPLVLFLMARWAWRWLLWAYVLLRLSRQRIELIGTHPDNAAGLEPLSWPLTAFAGYLFALSSILAGAWGTQLIDGRMTVPRLAPTVVLFLVLAFIGGCAPLLLFTGHVYRAHRRAIAQYSTLAHDYVWEIQHKWIDGQPGEPLLGTPDIQSWNDLRGVFENLANVRLSVFGMRPLRTMLLASLVPLVPLLATTVSVNDVVHKFGGLLLGG